VYEEAFGDNVRKTVPVIILCLFETICVFYYQSVFVNLINVDEYFDVCLGTRVWYQNLCFFMKQTGEISLFKKKKGITLRS
jgi:hypothetical protein